MTEITSLRPLAAIAVSAVATVAILAARNHPNIREGSTFLASALKLGLVASMVPAAAEGVQYVSTVGSFAGVALVFRADALGVLFALLAAIMWPIAALYSVGYLRTLEERSQGRFFAAFAASLSATVGVAFAGNLLTLFVCYEVLTVATYPLVVHKQSDAARAAGTKYLRYTLGGGAAVLAGTALVSVLAGTVTFTPGGIASLATADPLLARAAFALLVAGFGVKAALMPLHGWLPSAMVAPTPVSGLLHAVAVVKSGVFGIVRVVGFVFGPDAVASLGVGQALAVAAAVTMTLSGLIALRQDRIKRGLAYSTISQLSYVVLGVAVLSPIALFGALLHLVAHALMKVVLFFCAGTVYVETHVERIDELAGISRRLPLTMAMFAVASAGLVGFPLVAGFVSKWYLLTGLFGSGSVLFAGVLLLAGLLKLLFFWPILSAAFFETAGDDGGHEEADGRADAGAAAGTPHADGGVPAADPHHGTGWESRTWRTESDWRLLAPIGVGLALAVAFGVVPTELPFFDLAERAVTEVYG